MGHSNPEFKRLFPQDGLGDFHPEAPTVTAERSYRRGVQHGAHMALEAVEAGVGIGDLRDWVFRDLYRYRLDRFAPADRAIRPPKPRITTGGRA